MKTHLLFSSLLATLVAVFSSLAADKPSDQPSGRKPASFWMQKKLDESQAENIDGAALAYLELTPFRVNCHKHLGDRAGR